MKVISGGQTGVDRAALDAALALGVEVGGWCPEGRLAEDGTIPEHYPLQELPGAGYRQRTRKNVIDSDGTAIIYFGSLSGGTEQTVEFCIKEGKPHVLIDAGELSIDTASRRIVEFIRVHGIGILNVAGPRASGEPGGYVYAHEVMLDVLRRHA
jgi:hypothetical protein